MKCDSKMLTPVSGPHSEVSLIDNYGGRPKVGPKDVPSSLEL